MADDLFPTLLSLRDALDSQDAILREAMAANPKCEIDLPAALPIKRIFDEILAAVAGLIGDFDYHANPSALRAQIAGARRKVQDKITMLDRQAAATRKTPPPRLGQKIFIGHGHALLWLQLKDFIETRLQLRSDEFNREPAAGMFTGERLATMLDDACFALLVMTGEDEQSDGRKRARENVVHEAGLFQGRLGFKRAIILLEDGCSTFSNIAGLTVIPFPKGTISASFEEIRKTLEREGICYTEKAAKNGSVHLAE